MNTSHTPPGGWQFFEPATNWWGPSPIAFTFDQQVENIIKHRQANPAVTAQHQLSTSFNAVAQELMAFNKLRLGIVDESPKSSAPGDSSRSFPGAVAAVSSGAKLLMKWLGDGGVPAEVELAYYRARVCSTCALNEQGDWTRLFTKPASELIRRQIEKKSEMELKTPFDDELGVCTGCYCPLKLKVWTPLHYLVFNMKPHVEEIIREKKPDCWILKEQTK